MPTEFRIFDSAHGQLLKGITLVEASAGTGKTYAITMLVLRAVVELQVPIDKILIVTFTKAATEELRQRIRNRLVEAQNHLAGKSVETAATDPTLCSWAEDLGDRPKALSLLQLALADIDRAGVFTIHGFCQRMLVEQALESGQLFDVELLTDIEHIRLQIAEDFWRSRIYRLTPLPCGLVLRNFPTPEQLLASVSEAKRENCRIEPQVGALEEILLRLDMAMAQLTAWWQESGNELKDLFDKSLDQGHFKKTFSDDFDLWFGELAAFFSGATAALPAFLAKFGHELETSDLNQLKLKILSLLKMAAQGKIAAFTLENLYINRESLNPAVDLFNRQGNIDAAQELERFNTLLSQHKLFFVKPDKKFFSLEKQSQAEDAFFDFVMQKLAPCECVRKIYLLGSAKNHRSGQYQVPFVHFDWAKLNSDFDIYIELDPDYDGPLPEEWDKKFFWHRTGCDYYHFGDVGNGMASEYAQHYPGIHFFDHLVEGYLFHPTTGDKSKKDTWFREIKARCIFSRDKVGEWINHNYTITAQESERFNVASFNKVYHVFAKPDDFVLKVYDSKYLTKKNKEKIAYEIGLLDFLKDSGLEVALPVKNKNGKYISQKDKEQAVLFTFAPGTYVANPNREEILLAGELLARFHAMAKPYKSKLANTYSNKQLLFYWLDAWKEYHNQGGIIGTDIDLDIPYYNQRLHDFNVYPTHCHGDLSVINYLFHQDKCWLIDFQSVGYGPALIDLANGMVEFAARKNDFSMENLQFFKEGYESVRRLTAGEQHYLTDLLTTQIAGRQAKLLRLHYGGFGYELKEARILGLRKGLEIIGAGNINSSLATSKKN